MEYKKNKKIVDGLRHGYGVRNWNCILTFSTLYLRVESMKREHGDIPVPVASICFRSRR